MTDISKPIWGNVHPDRRGSGFIAQVPHPTRRTATLGRFPTREEAIQAVTNWYMAEGQWLFRRTCPACGFIYAHKSGRIKYCSRRCSTTSAKSRAKGDLRKYGVSQVHLKNRYGLSGDDYQALVARQNGRCAICQEPAIPLNVDHCHSSGRIRGLLCRTCNWGLGMFHDSPDKLQSAVKYLGTPDVPNL